MGRESLPLASNSLKASSGGLLVGFQFARYVGVRFRSKTGWKGLHGFGSLRRLRATHQGQGNPGGPVTGLVAGRCLPMSLAPDLERNCSIEQAKLVMESGHFWRAA